MEKIFFKDFITLQRGFDLPKKDFIEGKYPVVGSTSILGYHNTYKVEPPGVITGRSGSLGFIQYICEKYWPHNTSLWVKDFKGNYPKYVYYFLKTIDLSNFNSGTGVPTLNRNDLDLLEITISSLSTQKKIATILSAYDDLIENNNRRIALLEQMARLLYEEWFVKFRFPGYKKVKMINSELGMIPEGWEVVSLKQTGTVITGKTPSTKNEDYYNDNYMPFIKTPDMHNNIFVLNTNQYLSKLGADTQKNKTLPENSICVSCIGTAGVVAITSVPSQTNQQINSIILNDLDYLEYLFFSIQNLKDIIIAYGGIGATMVNLNKTKFEELKIIQPESNILKKFNVITSPMFKNIKKYLVKNNNLKQAHDLLLPKLINGEIDVEDLDIKAYLKD